MITYTNKRGIMKASLTPCLCKGSSNEITSIPMWTFSQHGIICGRVSIQNLIEPPNDVFKVLGYLSSNCWVRNMLLFNRKAWNQKLIYIDVSCDSRTSGNNSHVDIQNHFSWCKGLPGSTLDGIRSVRLNWLTISNSCAAWYCHSARLVNGSFCDLMASRSELHHHSITSVQLLHGGPFIRIS